ncbi:formate dehydrogenase subunit gamma [Terrarubrum flagellatum]|uniref:formate dehydrogenase subunit gamma n=1 Tax=Terrirubrum flagellatum TaxID=2895980 RepID=UPI003144D5FC
MTAYEPWNAERASQIIAEHAALEGATLPIMHAMQEAFGHVPDAAVPMIADALNLSRAEIHGCLTFYHDFRRQPAGRHVVKLCRAEACQSVGADALHADIKRELNVDWHETTADGEVTIEPVFCLGLCTCGPAALIDGKPVGALDVGKLRAALGRSH